MSIGERRQVLATVEPSGRREGQKARRPDGSTLAGRLF